MVKNEKQILLSSIFLCIILIWLRLFIVAPVKILSKKEKKRLEQEEFDRLMNEVPVEAQPEAAATAEESKQSAEASAADEKKRLAN